VVYTTFLTKGWWRIPVLRAKCPEERQRPLI
jgi:hypothetical protein